MRLLVLSLAWIAGLLIGLQFGLPLPSLYLFLASCAVFALLLNATRRSVWPALIVALLVAGMLRAEADGSGIPLLSRYNGVREVQVEGVIVEDPETRGTSIKVVVEATLVDRPDVKGKLLAWVLPTSELVYERDEPYLRYGDRVRLKGMIESPEPFAGFDYPGYLANQGVFSVMYRPRVEVLEEGLGSPALKAVYALRHKLARGLALSLPGDQAALAQALLLGIRSGIPQEMNEAFRNTGTSHILAISGLHVGVLLALLVGISVWLFGRRRNMYLLLPLIGVWLYVVLSGFSASAERSAVMATVYLAALALGRQQSVLPALALAAGVMAGVDPKTLKDISFQLSATAVAGIVLLGPLISRWIVGLSGGRLERTPTFGIVDGVATGVAATVATLPLLAFHFHRVSVVGVPATLLLLPALSIALVISTIAAAFGLVGGVVASVVGWIAYVPLAYMCGLVDLLARLPGASFSASANGLAVWLFYSMGMAVLLAPRFLRRYMGFRRDADEQGQTIQMIPQSRPVAIAIPVVLASAAFLFWMAALSAPDSRVHITFFDVGQSDSILIETPSGRQILIDGGSDPRKIAHHLGKRLPFWDRSLDAVVLTHPEEDHLAGLVEVAKRYELGIVFEGLGQKGKPLYQEWSEVLEERGVQVVWVRAGYRVPVEENIMLEVLGPPERAIEGSSATNDNSVVLRLVCGEVEFLLPGDIQQRGEWWLLESGQLLRSDVLKVAHHGSGMSSSSRFLAGVSPTVAVISVGDNTFGHPSEEVGSRLDEFNINVLTTKERGNIEMTTDGRQVWVRTEK